MDDWNPTGKPWMLYVEIGVVVVIVLAVAIAYAVSRVAPFN
jgi:hypothetical protein